LAISKFIDSKTEEKQRAARTREKKGMKKSKAEAKSGSGEQIYKIDTQVKEPGKPFRTVTKYGTAAELGLSQEEIDSGVATKAEMVEETSGGKSAGLLAAGSDVALSGAFARSTGMVSMSSGNAPRKIGQDLPSEVQAELSAAAEDGKPLDQLAGPLTNLDAAMAMYTKRFKQDLPNIEDAAVGTMLESEFNQIRSVIGDVESQFAALGADSSRKKIFDALGKEYPLFSGVLKGGMAGKGEVGRAKYTEGGFFAGAAKIVLPGSTPMHNQTFFARDANSVESSIASTPPMSSRRQRAAEDLARLKESRANETPEDRQDREALAARLSASSPNAAGNIDSLMDTNANLKAPAGGGGSASPSVTNVSQTATSNTMVPNNPRRVGDDIPNNMSPALAI
jgi:hypothetical protein